MNNPLSFLVTFAFSFILMKLLLPLLKKVNAKQEILQYVEEHKKKSGTPTMGGISFIVAIIVSGCIFCDISQRAIAVSLAVFFAYGIVGFLDDFIKVHFGRNQGLLAYQKILFQIAIAFTVALFVYRQVGLGGLIRVPFSQLQLDIGFWIIPLVMFIYLASTNGVNLTDGIDGLATSSTICFLFGMVILLQKEMYSLDRAGDIFGYKQVEQVTTLCYLSCGALLSFLLFNSYHAKVFMGDTGSLALGALVACVAIFTRMSLFIPIIGIMFVVSCLSVIVQVAYFKISKGKRVFLMAPYHHHLQKKGWSETRICVLYCTISVIFTFIAVCLGE